MIGQSPEVPEPQAVPAQDARPDAGVEPPTPPMPREFGGRDGPEPTRYGDWEKNGRCVDF